MKGAPGGEHRVVNKGSRAMIAATSGKLLEDGMTESRAFSAANNIGITTLLKSICSVAVSVSPVGSNAF